MGEELRRIRGLSDGELLAGLGGSLGASRRAVAAVLAHLAEVEERRLHVLGGYSSLFAYCVSKLGMSEDEAYRRIEVARLARRFPVLLERLARGQLSLSVAALLKTHLADSNAAALIEAISGKTQAQAREVLAACFPRQDVMPLIRKLPGHRSPSAASVAKPASKLEPAPGQMGLDGELALGSMAPTEPMALGQPMALGEPPSPGENAAAVSQRALERPPVEWLQAAAAAPSGSLQRWERSAVGTASPPTRVSHARGGGSHPSNIRLLCHAHNRLAAELAYGCDAIARSITRRHANGPLPSNSLRDREAHAAANPSHPESMIG